MKLALLGGRQRGCGSCIQHGPLLMCLCGGVDSGMQTGHIYPIFHLNCALLLSISLESTLSCEIYEEDSIKKMSIYWELSSSRHV